VARPDGLASRRPALSSTAAPSGRYAARDADTRTLLGQALAETSTPVRIRLQEQAVTLNQGLALGVARPYHGRGLDAEDIDQVALLGLWKAVLGYTPDYGTSFAAYAIPTITGEVKRYFRDHGWLVRPTRSVQEQTMAVKDAVSSLRQQLRREPSDPEIADQMGISRSALERARLADHGFRARSLDAPLPGANRTLGDVLGSDEDPYTVVDTTLALRSAIRELSDRDRRILQLRFVDGLTQEQVGRHLGISQMHVSRLLGRIVRHLDGTLAAAS
jgi:RNA polymerase sigma-B factor